MRRRKKPKNDFVQWPILRMIGSIGWDRMASSSMEQSQQPQPVLPMLLADDEIHALQGYEMHLLGEGTSNFISCQSAA